MVMKCDRWSRYMIWTRLHSTYVYNFIIYINSLQNQLRSFRKRFPVTVEYE